ncbi:hypothetical protein SDRG_09337 [Saprolegnia diclina VS20]|uniref:TIR domain-containing protein n=1 Tax=Saprolegnia diclina (strain VS20) TaxID=1156394 RepID=T0RKE5_SAPDV|nr:hypothetical protein SDRG_09337 [Saprolegnia diclina VS20]EQC32798.1 hypothetical protein SDRG_09337 [Saprolegnia diclina VS20]|eukprot:XP_008613484.1 hypothetical protein SDRG_09337 [Saprolegnia diclina VS20]
MGAGASTQDLRQLSASAIAAEVVGLGSAYAPYEAGILANGVDGDVVAHLQSEQLPMLFGTLGVTNTIHQTKLASLHNQHRKALLSRSLSMANGMDARLSTSPRQPKAFDVFLSHNWGHDELGRDNHARVATISAFLRQNEIKTWFDQDKMSGNILKAMANGIEESQIVLVFVTQLYQNKVNGDNANDNCQLEFGMAKATQTAQWMIPVIMDPSMKAPRHWCGQFKLVLGNQLYVDLTSDEDDAFLAGCHTLLQRIDGLLLKLGRPSVIPPTHRSSQETQAPSSPRNIDSESELSALFASWQRAIEAPDVDAEQDTVAAIVDLLSSPDVALPSGGFPWSLLVHGFTAPSIGLQDDACAMGVLLLDRLPTTAESLLSFPTVLPFLLDAVTRTQGDIPPNAVVLLCNLSSVETAAPTLLSSPLIERLLANTTTKTDDNWLPRLETVANLAGYDAAKDALLPYYAHLVAIMAHVPSVAWCVLRICLHVAGHEASAACLLEANLLETMLALLPRPDEMVLKVVRHLVQHPLAASRVGSSTLWGSYLLQQTEEGTFEALCHHTIAGLSVESQTMQALLPHAHAWLPIWAAAIAKGSSTVTTIVCNLSLLSEWAPLLSAHAALLNALGQSVHDASNLGAAKSLANLSTWAKESHFDAPALQAVLQAHAETWATLASTSDSEMQEIAKQILHMGQADA